MRGSTFFVHTFVTTVGLLVAVAAVTISNKEPRLDVKGAVVDCHNGNIVGPINGTYFMYGEWYGNGNFVVDSQQTDLPKLGVYTSTTLESGTWEFQGLCGV